MNSIDLGERLIRKADKVLSHDGITNATADDDTVPTTKTVKDYVDNQEHGNIHSDGSIGSTSGLPIKTGSGGVLETGTFGTTAGTFAEGNHTHGNVNSNGSIGSTSGLPIKTGSGGVLETGTFGTTAGTFAEGNHTHTAEQIAPLVTNKTDKDNGASQMTDNNYIQYNSLTDSYSEGTETNLSSLEDNVTQAIINSAINYSIGYLRDENNNRSDEINNIEEQLIGQSLMDKYPSGNVDLDLVKVNGLYYGNDGVYSRTVHNPGSSLTIVNGYYLNVYSNENDDSLVQTITYIGTRTGDNGVETGQEIYQRVYLPLNSNFDRWSKWERIMPPDVAEKWKKVYEWEDGDNVIYLEVNEYLRLAKFVYFKQQPVINGEKIWGNDDLNINLRNALYKYTGYDQVIPCYNPSMNMAWNYESDKTKCQLKLWSKVSGTLSVNARAMWRY